jgi:hypothetical protein
MGKLSYPGERQLLAAEQKERQRERIAKSGTQWPKVVRCNCETWAGER